MNEPARLILKNGAFIHGRYRVISEYPSGATSNVYGCYDTKFQKNVVIKAYVCEECSSTIDREVLILEKIKSLPNSGNHFTNLYEKFTYSNHVCIVMEQMGLNLYQVLQFYKFHPFKRVAIQQILKQLVETLLILHEYGFYHTDLKPENVLVDLSIKPTNDENVFLHDNCEQPSNAYPSIVVQLSNITDLMFKHF